MDPIEIEPIGVVRNGESDVGRTDWSAVETTIELQDELRPALLGLRDYSHLFVVGWLDQYPEELRRRDAAYPNGDEAYPLQGALALRGARPNPISITVCRLKRVEGASLIVQGLDLIDATPILDVKPYIAYYDSVPSSTIPKWARG